MAMLTIHQAFLLHRCPHDPQSMSCALAVKVYLHDPDFQDGVRWFQSLLLLAPLFGTGLHVPYPLVVGAQLCASLLSMHIFVHASRFEAYDGMSDDTADATFAPLFYGNASSQLSLYKPSTSSSMRVTLYQLAPLGLSLTLAAFFKRTQLSSFIELDKLSRQLCAGRGVGGR